MKEDQNIDHKSLRIITGGTARWDELAKDCVCFANSLGGRIFIGIENSEFLPPENQIIDPVLIDKIRKRIGELTVNVQVAPQIISAENKGQYIELSVARAMGVASTSDGRYFLRIADGCKPVVGDDVMRLINDRASLPWEAMISLHISRSTVDSKKMDDLLKNLRASDRVKSSVKEKTDQELLDHYGLADRDYLTNLGILLIGVAADRARLGVSPIVQFIKYDELGNKVHKLQWDDYQLSPVELPDAIWQGIPDFRESYELPDGLYRQKVPAFDERVIRELLVNALVHRPYTQRGDIYLNLYPDRLEVVNPGRLPLGVTPQNILHESRRRNDRLATLFHDLKLMEKEGSGFDLMYELQLSLGRPVPVAREGTDSVHVAVKRRIIKPEVIELLKEADSRYHLTQREKITLGLLAQTEGLTAINLAKHLELESVEALQPWLGRLLDLGLIKSLGRTRATRYFVEPNLLRGAKLDEKTTLSRIESHRLKALILEDLKRYPESSSSEINRRIGVEISLRTVRRALDDLVKDKHVRFEGERRWRKYWVLTE